MATIQIPVLFDMSGDTLVFGEEVSGDFVSSHLDFLLDMTTEANDISLNAADISSAILIGDQDIGDNIFFSGGTSSNIAVDNLCNRIAKAVTRGKLVHIPKNGDSSNSGIPMGGRLYVVRADGQQEVPPDGQYAEKYPHSISPIGDEQMLGEAMARVASVHLMGTPLAAGILVDQNSIQTDLETASGQTFNSGGTAFYNALAVQLSKVLGGSKSSAPMNNGLTTVVTATTSSNTQTKITASDGAAGDYFGYNVAVSGDYAIISSFQDDDTESGSGSAYIFNVTNGNQVHKLVASDPGASDQFGKDVAISGNYAIVGAPLDDDGASNSGSAYIFNVTTGAQLRKLTASDAAGNDRFGDGVSIDGNYAIVGAKNHGSPSIGAVYVFDVTNGNQLRKLTPSDGADADYFGNFVAISGNNAIVGAYGHGTNGAAYIFDVTNGNQLRKLTTSDTTANDDFARSVAISGNYAIVGEYNHNNNGAAYIFDVTTGNELRKLTASDGASGDRFGWNVSIDGDFAIVGAYGDGDTYAGSAYLFNVQTGAEIQKYTATDTAATDRFGHGVALSGGYAIAGAYEDDDDGASSGSAYIFTYTTATTTTHPLDASGVSVPALKSIYEQLMNVSGRSQIMPTRDISGVVDNSNSTLTGGFPFITGDKLVMYLRPKIVFAASTQAESNNALYTFNYTGTTVLTAPAYNISDKNGNITGQTYSQSSSQDNTDFIFEHATDGNGAAAAAAQYWITAANTYHNTTGVHSGANALGSTNLVDGANTVAGEYGQVDIGQNTFATELQLTTNGANNDRMATDFKLLGSTNGTNWVTLIDKTGAGPWVDDTPQTFTIASPASYRYYRYIIIKCYNAVSGGNISNRGSLGYFNLRGGKFPSEVIENTNAGLMDNSPLDISGLQTNVVASSASIQSAFPGNATTGPEAETSKWGWMGSVNSDSLTLDCTDVTDPRTIDLHIWKITITL